MTYKVFGVVGLGALSAATCGVGLGHAQPNAINPPATPIPNSTPANANSPQPNAAKTAAAVDAQSGTVGEVVVTAQRRSESAQKVPIAIQTFSVSKLAQLGATSTADLPKITPGFQIVPSGAGQAFFLRGVGNNNTNPGFESEVSTYVDGVYMPFQNGNLQAFGNIASIEVDKGPQGTLFGRNATGGVIQISTRTPTSTPKFDATVGYANYNTVSGSFYGGSGVTNQVSSDFALYFDDQMNGWGKDINTGQDVFKFHDFGVRTKTVYTPTSNTTIILEGDYSSSGGSAGTDIKPVKGRSTLFNEVTGGTFTLNNFYDVDANFRPHYNVQEGGASAKIRSDLGWGSFQSISAWLVNTANENVDYDGTPVDFLDLAIRYKDEAESQELQLLSPSGSWLTWAAGFFFYNEEGQAAPFPFGGLAGNIVFGAPVGQAYNIVSTVYDHSYAVYGQATAPILDHTRLTLGVRYTIDDRAIHGKDLSGTALVPGTDGSQTKNFYKPTFRVSLDHDFTSTILGYASFNRGFHSGVFNIISTGGFNAAQDAPVRPEQLDAYEAGFKTQFLDRRLTFNLSGFYYNYTNLQQQEFQGAALVTLNAASAVIDGADIDISVHPIEHLTLSAGVEYLNAFFISYPGAPIYTLEPNGALAQAPGNAAGKQLPAAPPWSYTLNAAYTLPTEVGDFDTSVALAYNNGFFADPGNTYREPEYYILNFSEMWRSRDKRYDVTIYGKNLTQTHYDLGVTVLSPVGYDSLPGAPRTYGFRFGVHF